MTTDPIKQAIQAAADKIVAQAITRVRRDVVAALDKALAGGAVETPRPRLKPTAAAVESAIDRLVRRQTMTDYAIAKKLGIDAGRVRRCRVALGLPAVGQVKTKKPARAKAGPKPPTTPAIRSWGSLSPDSIAAIEADIRSRTIADAAIARKHNVQQPKVSERRRAMGLPALGIAPGSGLPNFRGMPIVFIPPAEPAASSTETIIEVLDQAPAPELRAAG